MAILPSKARPATPWSARRAGDDYGAHDQPDWREIDWRYGLGLIEAGLKQAMADGGVTKRPTKALAHLLFGALCESALLIARAPKPRQAFAQVRRELDGLLAALLSRA